MLNFDLLRAEDIKEAAAFEKKRRYEEERKKRIFNAKNRISGADYSALGKQIEEKKQRIEQEKRMNDLFDEQRIRDDYMALVYERKEKEERKNLIKQINEFRENYQKFEDRREYDLNDPKAVLKSLPVRVADNDPRLGISCAQKFEGEDLASDERRKLMAEQKKAWLEQQMKEQKAAEQELKAADDAYQAAVVARDARATELDRLEKECRKQLDQAVRKYNISIVEQQNVNKDIKKRRELEDNFAEMYNAVTGDFLTENPKVCQSNFGPGHVIGFMYKGMTPEERNAVRAYQMKQVEENKVKREADKRMNEQWEDYIKNTDLQLIKRDEEMRLKQKELTKELSKYNESLAEEQKAYQEYMKKVVYTNKPTASYYAQFNTTSR